MEFKISADDFIEYNIFPSSGNLSDQELSELRDQCLQVLAPFVVNYLWHQDAFHLQAVAGSPKVRSHLRGRVQFGDNIEDEWFTVALVLHLTSVVDVVATLRDSDGEVLLIEASEHLPQWAQGLNSLDGLQHSFKWWSNLLALHSHLIPITNRFYLAFIVFATTKVHLKDQQHETI